MSSLSFRIDVLLIMHGIVEIMVLTQPRLRILCALLHFNLNNDAI